MGRVVAISFDAGKRQVAPSYFEKGTEVLIAASVPEAVSLCVERDYHFTYVALFDDDIPLTGIEALKPFCTKSDELVVYWNVLPDEPAPPSAPTKTKEEPKGLTWEQGLAAVQRILDTDAGTRSQVAKLRRDVLLDMRFEPIPCKHKKCKGHMYAVGVVPLCMAPRVAFLCAICGAQASRH